MRRAPSIIVVVTTASLVGLIPWATPLRSQAPTRDAAAPRTPVAETSAISGIVVLDGPSTSPVRRAIVTISSAQAGVARTAVTDDAGRFTVASLPAGRFTVSAAKAAHAPIRSVRALTDTVTLAEGQHASNVTRRLARGAVIAGRVVDPGGLPVSMARITVAERRLVGTQITTRPVTLAAGPGATMTDDRGTFRVFGLAAGTYVVAVAPPALTVGAIATAAELNWARQSRTTAGVTSPPPRAPATYAPVYFPGAADLERATPITVTAGEERSGVDIALELVGTTDVRGQVMWDDGQPARNVLVMALARTRVVAALSALPVRYPPTGADGRFVLSGLLPGRYLLTARAARPAAGAGGRGGSVGPGTPLPVGRAGPAGASPELWAVTEITAAGPSIDGLVLVLKPGLKLSGRMTFESQTGRQPTAEEFARASVTLASPPDGGVTVRVTARGAAPDGSFAAEGLMPGSYVVTSSIPASGAPRWLVKSATVRGRDVLDTPLEVLAGAEVSDLVVTFTDHVSELSGRVTDKLDRPTPEFYVVAFSIDPTRWRQGSRWLAPPRRPTPEGRYTFTGLPPGEYYLAVLPEYEQSIWYTPEYLEQVVPGAIKVTIGEGEKKTQDVRLGM